MTPEEAANSLVHSVVWRNKNAPDEALIARAIRNAENAALERAAKVAEQPYNAVVNALGSDSPIQTAHKISDAIRRLRTRAPRRPKGAT